MGTTTDKELLNVERFMGTRMRGTPEKKRSMPRGILGKSFWDRQFREVQEIIEDWGYEVELSTGANDRVELGEVKTIHINSACHPETKFYTLLHEVGHIMVRKDWKRFSKNYPNYLDGPDAGVDGRRERRKSYRIGVIAEEIEAWKRGRSFADRHSLYVDVFKYDYDANTSLMTYIDWIAEISQTQAKAGRQAAKTRKTQQAKKPRTKAGR
jgi:hypothetical protein